MSSKDLKIWFDSQFCRMTFSMILARADGLWTNCRLDELFSLSANIPVPHDFIATTETQAKKTEIERTAATRSGIRNVIVRVVEENCGRDMAALFVTCRDLFIENHYDIVRRLHAKKSSQVMASRSNLFKRHMFENLLASRGYVTNVLDMFKARPWIGLAVPPIVQISYWTLGHSWYTNRTRAEELRSCWISTLTSIGFSRGGLWDDVLVLTARASEAVPSSVEAERIQRRAEPHGRGSRTHPRCGASTGCSRTNRVC